MRLDIKWVKRARLNNRECYGVTRFFKDDRRAIIYISRAANKNVAQYAMTLLHELLHVWIALLRRAGSKVDSRRDHTFIYAVEKVIVKFCKRILLKRAKAK